MNGNGTLCIAVLECANITIFHIFRVIRETFYGSLNTQTMATFDEYAFYKMQEMSQVKNRQYFIHVIVYG